MTHVGYVLAGYGITFGVLGVYAAWIMRRTRSLARQLSSATSGTGSSSPVSGRSPS